MQLRMALAMVCATLILSFSTTSSFAQTASPIEIIYIESNQLTPEVYGELLNKFKNDPVFEISEACVPAHVLSVKIKTSGENTKSAIFNAFKQKASNTSLTELSLLEDYNDEKFMTRCSNARYGR